MQQGGKYLLYVAMPSYVLRMYIVRYKQLGVPCLWLYEETYIPTCTVQISWSWDPLTRLIWVHVGFGHWFWTSLTSTEVITLCYSTAINHHPVTRSNKSDKAVTPAMHLYQISQELLRELSRTAVWSVRNYYMSCHAVVHALLWIWKWSSWNCSIICMLHDLLGIAAWYVRNFLMIC